jgi:hypothetical protein
VVEHSIATTAPAFALRVTISSRKRYASECPKRKRY